MFQKLLIAPITFKKLKEKENPKCIKIDLYTELESWISKSKNKNKKEKRILIFLDIN